jgi:hypothetical protein
LATTHSIQVFMEAFRPKTDYVDNRPRATHQFPCRAANGRHDENVAPFQTRKPCLFIARQPNSDAPFLGQLAALNGILSATDVPV